MSVYRFLRASTMLALARRYRQKLFGILVAIAVALTTSWLYSDIASYLQNHHPQWLLAALVTKTIIVYGVLVYLVWQLRPSAWGSESPEKPASPTPPGASAPGPLDELLEKPKLKSRRESLLDETNQKAP